jgi:predicted phage-related endonuclease
MKMSNRQVHDLIQGSDEWLLFRQSHHGASEAAAMLGLSSKVKRNELLHMKHTGTAKEFSDWVQEHILDHGHEVEAMARPIVEELIGEDLYPVTCSDGDLSASCDGLTMSEEIAFEHKQYNAGLSSAVRAGVLPDEYMPQCQQVMLVTGAKKVIFVVSDGTRDQMEHMEIFPDNAWFERIHAGWQQFAKDLATYVPAVVVEKPLGRTPETLPALRLEVTGMVTASNLAEFKDHALAVFGSINRELTTDQQFADAEKTVKWCGEVESRLSAAKEHALSQTQSIDLLFKTIDDISAEARSVRLELDNLVTRRKVEIKENIILGGKRAYEQHIASLKEETGGPWIALPIPDFAGSAKGKRTMASIQDGVDTVLANAKIAADASAKAIRASLTCLREETAGFEFLFSDKLSLIGKPMDDLKLVIKTRIADHQAAEEKRREEDRARIQAEEERKAEAKVRAQAAQEAAEAAVKAAQEAAAARAAEQPAPVVAQATPAPVIERTPIAVSRSAPVAHADPVGAPTLRLGQINERLAPIALSAEGLASLGFTHAATDKAAKLYHESSFPLICAALVRHIESASSGQKKAA